MLKDKRISRLVDYPIASDVFPGVKVIGGICYFLWQSDYNGPCRVTTRMNNVEDNRAFWRAKLTRNQERDRLVTRMLRKAGWRVRRIWEHELKKGRLVARMRRTLAK